MTETVQWERILPAHSYRPSCININMRTWETSQFSNLLSLWAIQRNHTGYVKRILHETGVMSTFSDTICLLLLSFPHCYKAVLSEYFLMQLCSTFSQNRFVIKIDLKSLELTIVLQSRHNCLNPSLSPPVYDGSAKRLVLPAAGTSSSRKNCF